jgi:hypothetical protein
LALIGCVVFLKGVTGASGGTRPADNRSEAAALRALAWLDAAARKNLDAVVGYMADDGETLAPNEPAARGRDAIRAFWSSLLGLPGVAVRWEPQRLTRYAIVTGLGHALCEVDELAVLHAPSGYCFVALSCSPQSALESLRYCHGGGACFITSKIASTAAEARGS